MKNPLPAIAFFAALILLSFQCEDMGPKKLQNVSILNLLIPMPPAIRFLPRFVVVTVKLIVTIAMQG
jgi:hypothetical protein